MFRLTLEKVVICFISFILGCTFTMIFLIGDRNFMSDKENIDSIIHDKSSSDIFLIILIFSSLDNIGKREAIRDTWVSDIGPSSQNAKYFFVISCRGATEVQKNSLNKEQENFSDLLLFPNIEDSFFNLTIKLLAAFSWLTKAQPTRSEELSSSSKSFNNFEYVLKCDDDSFVRVQEIVKELKSGFAKPELYWGFFDGRAVPKLKGKYKENDWNICDYYIPYALGGGYVLSRKLVEFIANNSLYLKKYNSEDVSVGAWLSNFMGVNHVHDPRFDTEYISRGCHNSYLITHKYSVTAFRNFQKNLKETGKLCTLEFRTRLSYVYNWDVPPSKCCTRNSLTVP